MTMLKTKAGKKKKNLIFFLLSKERSNFPTFILCWKQKPKRKKRFWCSFFCEKNDQKCWPFILCWKQKLGKKKFCFFLLSQDDQKFWVFILCWKQKLRKKKKNVFLKHSFASARLIRVRQPLLINIVPWPFVWTPSSFKQGFVVQKKKSWLKFCFVEIDIERAERKTVWEFSFC